MGCVRFHGLLAGAARPPAGTGAARPIVLLRDGVVWDACRRARAAGVRLGQGAAAARAACPQALRLPVEAARPRALEPAWELLASAASVVEPDPDGRPEAMAAWPGGPPPLRELRGLLAAAAALPEVDLAIGLAPNRLLARACCPDPPPTGSGLPVPGEGPFGHGVAAGGRPASEHGAGVGDGAASGHGAAAGGTAPPAASGEGAVPLPWSGMRMVAPGGGARFLADWALADLAALGALRPALVRWLEGLGLFRCGDVAALAPDVLRARFGREGETLRDVCLGRDVTPVHALYPPRTLHARRAYPDGLPGTVLPEAAAALGRSAAAGLAPREGACRLVLCSPRGEVVRALQRPRRDPGLLARAASDLSTRAGRSWGSGPYAWLEVILTDLAVTPVVPVSLWGGPAEPARRGALDDLLARLPRQLLRRGRGAVDRYETLVAFFDPWCTGR